MVRLVRFARFARNGSTCTNCRKLDTVRGSFRMCKTRMAWLTHEIFDDDGKTIWKEGERYIVIVAWKSKGKKGYVEWQFEQDEVSEDVAKLAWLLDDHKSFSEECTPSNVTEDDAWKASVLVGAIVEALHEGDRATLDHLGAMVALIDGPDKRDRKRARFVDELKELAITTKAAQPERQDEYVTGLVRRIAQRYSAAFGTLDPAMVKSDVSLIDPHSKGGRQKGGEPKKGPPWLAARLIVKANAHEDFDLYRRRPNQTEDEHFDYVVEKLQNACRPGRGKPKASAKKP